MGIMFKVSLEILSNCVSENYESGEEAIFVDEETLGTRQLNIARAELNFLPFYKLSSQILAGSPIT